MNLDTYIFVFKQVWPMLLIFSVVMITLKIANRIINKEKLNLIKELIDLFFFAYIFMLFYVVTFQDVDWSTYNVTLFQEILRYEAGSEMFYRNIVGNLILFIPYGLYITYYLKIKKPYVIIILAFILSLTIETTQFYIGRVFDVDDILLNIIGALIGYYLYRIVVRIVGWKR